MEIGNGGWARFSDDGGGSVGVPGYVYVRATADERGRLRIVELYVDARGEPLERRHLANFPLHELEASVNAHADAFAVRMQLLAVDLSRAASYFSTSFARPGSHWVADMLWSQVKDSGVKKPPFGPDPSPEQEPPPRPPLGAPESLDETFFTALAEAYRDVVSRREPPAPTLAQEAGVSERTIHRWVYEARKRGYLPPAHRGRAG